MEALQTQNIAQVSAASTQRVAYWDVAKAIAIICVIWGHCLQNMTVDSDYWHTDFVSRLIISFHMPLFMLISGYFAYNSLFRPVALTLKKKAIQLILPSVSWYLVISLLAMAFHRDFRIDRFVNIITTLPYSYWFLKSLFACYIITLIGAKLMQWNKWSIILYTIAIFIGGEILNYASTISMLPFFIAGIIAHNYKFVLSNYRKSLTVINALLFIALFLLYDSSDYNMYLNPFAHNKDGHSAFLIRTLIGLSGSLSILCLIRYICLKLQYSKIIKLLAITGTITLGIYCIQVIMAEGLLKSSSDYLERFLTGISDNLQILAYDFIITPIATIITMLFAIVLIKKIRQYKYAKLILLGEMK